jgi:hypothetical protein
MQAAASAARVAAMSRGRLPPAGAAHSAGDAVAPHLPVDLVPTVAERKAGTRYRNRRNLAEQTRFALDAIAI